MASEVTNALANTRSAEELQIEKNKKRTSLGQDDFLRLMITQIKNQNPMEPQDNGEFIGQMAQFSTVSGLQDMQQSVEKLVNSFVSNQALQASSLVGRFVKIPATSGYLPPDDGQNKTRFFGAAELQTSTGNLQIQISSPTGATVKTINMGTQPAGMVDFSWDGTDNFGNPVPEGNYKITALASGDGEPTAVSTFFIAPVESVSLGKTVGDMKLNVARVGQLSMDQIREIL